MWRAVPIEPQLSSGCDLTGPRNETVPLEPLQQRSRPDWRQLHDPSRGAEEELLLSLLIDLFDYL